MSRLLALSSLLSSLLLLAPFASAAYSYPTLRRADPSTTAIAHREEDDKTFDYYHGDSFLTLGMSSHRPARVVLPGQQYFESGKKFPVILVLHGWGSIGNYHDFYMGVSVRASDPAFGGFIAIIANGTMNEAKHSRYWNARYCCDHNRTNVDDDAYLTGLINEAQNKYRVDDENIYAIGHSNGGVMSQILGCQHSHLFKGFVGLSPGIIPSMCWDTKAKKVLMVAGTEDDYFPVAYGHDNMKRWGKYLGCPRDPTKKGETRDYDCIPDAPASINDKYDFWRDKNCEKTGTDKETSILEWNGCGPQKDAKQALWLMENNSHNPAFNGKFSDDILRFLLVE